MGYISEAGVEYSDIWWQDPAGETRSVDFSLSICCRIVLLFSVEHVASGMTTIAELGFEKINSMRSINDPILIYDY